MDSFEQGFFSKLAFLSELKNFANNLFGREKTKHIYLDHDGDEIPESDLSIDDLGRFHNTLKESIRAEVKPTYLPKTRRNVKAKLMKIIEEDQGLMPGAIKGSSKLIGDLGLDNIDMIELFMDIEDSFDTNMTHVDEHQDITFDELVAKVMQN